MTVVNVNAHLGALDQAQNDDFYTAAVVEFSLPTTPNVVTECSSMASNIYFTPHHGSHIYLSIHHFKFNKALAMVTTLQLILSRIPKDTETYSMHITDSVVKRYSLKQLDELLIKHIPLSFAVELPSNNEIRRFCSDKICCEFTMKYKKHEMKVNESFHYKVTVFSGKEKQINEHSKEIYCAVVACTSDSTKSCGTRFQPSDNLKPSVKFERIKIKMIVELETAQNDYLVMPTNVDFSILPLDTSQYNFERSAVYSNEDKQYINYTTILTSENESIMTFGVLGRVFQLDEIGEEDIPSLLYLLLTVSNATNVSIWNENFTSYGLDEVEHLVSLSVFILFSFIFFAGLIGNGLVVIGVPFTATDYILNSWPFGDFMCRFVQYMIVVTCHASVYTLVLMSLDRYLAVVHPVSSIAFRTEKNASLSIAVIWLLITITGIPVMLSHGETIFLFDFNVVMVKCIFLSHEGYNWAAFQVSFFLSSYVVPLTLISVLYVCMLVSLWRGQAPGGTLSAESRRGKKRVTRMIVAVVLAFAICWLPIQVILVLKSIDVYHQTTFLVGFQIVSHVLAYLSSCVNPLLYAFLSENFRKAFRKVVKCGGSQTFQTRLTSKISRAGNGHSHDIL
ncbi:CLUMA_CG011047, isoform A [Clunio marinus]|uniref:CLUMA_CG011047, isoform A n=1 Tax=Clunio marinus TaxID=568069 RepID=A0A1J1IF88_9DIPT|nr:CLUMA_CG011047, isoform A [Clunio marinus]